MDYKFVVSSYMFFNERLGKEHLRLIADTGIRGIEIFCYRNHFDWKNNAYIGEIFGEMKTLGLHVHSFHAPYDELSTYDIAALDEKKRERALTEIFYALKILARMGGKSMVIHPGGLLVSDSRRNDYRKNAIMSLKLLTVYARELGIKMLVENTPSPELGSEADEFSEIFHALMDYRPGFCLDIGHAFISKGGIDNFYSLGKVPDELHISDNNGSRDEHLFPGEGNLSLKNVIDKLRYSYGDALLRSVFNFELRVCPDPDKLKSLIKRIELLLK